VRKGELTLARAVLDKARREGVAPDAFGYSCLVAGLVRQARLDEGACWAGPGFSAPCCAVLCSAVQCCGGLSCTGRPVQQRRVTRGLAVAAQARRYWRSS
jgi:hypothetical protein